MKSKSKIILLSILCILLLGGIGRSHYKIKVMESSIVELAEDLELQKEALTVLQSNFEIVVIDLYGEPKNK